MSEEEPREEPTGKTLVIFGRDVSKIPCFRSSFLYGTVGGLACGLAHFMFTSKVGKSTNYSVYSFAVITLGYWMQCRYKYSKAKFELLQLEESMRHQTILEGTEDDLIPIEVRNTMPGYAALKRFLGHREKRQQWLIKKDGSPTDYSC